MPTETLSLRKKKLALEASKLLKEYRLSRKQKAQCEEIIRDYEKYRGKQVLREFER